MIEKKVASYEMASYKLKFKNIKVKTQFTQSVRKVNVIEKDCQILYEELAKLTVQR